MDELKSHTRNQRRMYRIHKQEEKIHDLELLVGSLQQENQKYKEAIDKAVDIAWRYGQTDGDHHQKWVTDQMVRALLGSDYEKFVKEHEKEDYTWDIGIAP